MNNILFQIKTELELTFCTDVRTCTNKPIRTLNNKTTRTQTNKHTYRHSKLRAHRQT